MVAGTYLARIDVLDDLHFELVIGEDAQCLGPGHRHPFEGLVLGDDLCIRASMLRDRPV